MSNMHLLYENSDELATEEQRVTRQELHLNSWTCNTSSHGELGGNEIHPPLSIRPICSSALPCERPEQEHEQERKQAGETESTSLLALFPVLSSLGRLHDWTRLHGIGNSSRELRRVCALHHVYQRPIVVDEERGHRADLAFSRDSLHLVHVNLAKGDSVSAIAVIFALGKLLRELLEVRRNHLAWAAPIGVDWRGGGG